MNLGYKIIEDNEVKEIRMPKDAILFLDQANIDFLKNFEMIITKEIKKQITSGVIYVPKKFVGKKAMILILK